jgi:hypothetical protein
MTLNSTFVDTQLHLSTPYAKSSYREIFLAHLPNKNTEANQQPS